MLGRLWTNARIPSIISISFLTMGLVINPSSLILVIIVAFCGPLIGKTKLLNKSYISEIKKSDWKKIALLLTLIILALNREQGGLVFLVLAIVPILWAGIKDSSIFKNDTKNNSILSTIKNEEEQTATQSIESLEKKRRLLMKKNQLQNQLHCGNYSFIRRDIVLKENTVNYWI